MHHALARNAIQSMTLLLLAASTGCGDEGAAVPAADALGADTFADTAEVATVTVTASDAAVITRDSDATRYEVTVTIDNALSEAIPFGPGNFRMRAAGLEYAAVMTREDGCPSDRLLSPGASTSCLLEFSVPGSDAPTAIVMQTPVGVREAPTRSSGCADECNGVCVDTSTDPAHCGGCGQRVPSGATCQDSRVKCAGGSFDCNNRCVGRNAECTLDEAFDRTTTCKAECEVRGAQCVTAKAFYYCEESDSVGVIPSSCASSPPESYPSCTEFRSLECQCRL